MIEAQAIDDSGVNAVNDSAWIACCGIIDDMNRTICKCCAEGMSDTTLFYIEESDVDVVELRRCFRCERTLLEAHRSYFS